MKQGPVILVPRREGEPDRDSLWAWLRPWWKRNVRFPIFEGHHDEGPFNRSAAINAAAELAGDWTVAVIIDADVLIDPGLVKASIERAQTTGGPVLGYTERIHLDPAGSKKIMSGYRGDWRPFTKTQLWDSCSSCNVVTRELFEDVGGFDELFSGWGWEDVAFRCATETISGLELVKLDGTLWHLYHRTSGENNRRVTTFQANKARGGLYRAARWNVEETRKLIAEHQASDPSRSTSAFGIAPVTQEGRIPRRLIRTVPEDTSETVELWWKRFAELHPGWELITYRDPLDPADFPISSPHWDACSSGAQRAGLIRLEALLDGGIYVDSDVEPYRSLEPLLGCEAFAGWEDARCVPDAVIGARAGHPVIREALDLAIGELPRGAWHSGPGVTTALFPGRPDVTLLPPGSFYPYHYLDKAERRHEDHADAQPWAFAAHHWAASWLPA